MRRATPDNRRYQSGGGPTPKDLGAVAWWIAPGALPGYGAVTLDEASVADFDSWSATGITTPLVGATDPYGGSAAWALLEDTSTGAHRVYRACTAGIDSYTGFDVWIQAAGRSWVRLSAGTGAVYYAYVDSTNGVVGTKHASVTCTLVETIGTWRHWRLLVPVTGAWPAPQYLELYAASADGTVSYVGAGTVACNIYDPSPAQPRCAVLADESGNAEDLVQATDANQLLYYTGFKTINGIAVPYREAGRASYLSTTGAAVVGAFSGDDPSYAVVGVLAMANATNSYWLYTTGGAGSAYDAPLRIIGSGVQTARRDSSTTSSQTFSGVSASAFASPVVCTVIRKADRTTDLYLGGSLVSTAPALDDLGASIHTATSLGITGVVTTPDQQFPELAVFSGAHTHAELAGVEAAMKARWGV